MRWFLTWMADWLPCRCIDGPGGEPYLNRYAILVLGSDENPWFSLYLHRFIASDPGTGFHDHPWAWAGGMILSGSYVETLWRRQPEKRRPLSISMFGPGRWHRVDLPGNVAECWTLFAHGRRCKGWGFLDSVPNDNGTPPGETWVYHPYAEGLDNPTAGWWRKAPRLRGVETLDKLEKNG